jgi:hypothetical protein
MVVLSEMWKFLQGIGIRWSWRFQWTGCNNMKDALNLLDAIHLGFSRPEYRPLGDGTTHCNQFCSEVAMALGFKGLEGLLANDIIDLISKNDQWSELPIEKAQDLANGGSFIIAGLKANPHGHVVIVCPGKVKTSGRWGEVPSVANVGKDMFIGKGINWAFSDLPKLWVWRPTL